MTCLIDGNPCAEHASMVHGSEAEELRSGIERVVSRYYEDDDLDVDAALQCLLDRVDARDSLAFMEARDRVIHKAKEKRIAELEAFVDWAAAAGEDIRLSLSFECDAKKRANLLIERARQVKP